MAMEPGTWISLCAMLIALGALVLNAWKAFRERRADVRRDREAATKAGAERDSIAVHSAEAALLLMEKMLQTATQREQKATEREAALQEKLDALEWRYSKCADALEELEKRRNRIEGGS